MTQRNAVRPDHTVKHVGDGNNNSFGQLGLRRRAALGQHVPDTAAIRALHSADGFN